MTKNQFKYTDLSSKELESLKEKYIDLKVKSMNINDLRTFATENISLQIKSTIGNDEELEAWQEMEEFFKDEFDDTIRAIQFKIRSKNGEDDNLNFHKIKHNLEDKKEDTKIDMWED